jgi:hypothetical protein
MEGFKSKPADAENEPLKKRGWREMLSLALAGALSLGALEESRFEGPSQQETYASDWGSIREQTPFDLQTLESVAAAKIEVPGSQYVFHIAQMHGGGSLEATRKVYEKEGIPLEQLIECQKQIADVLTFLHSTYGIETVYQEGLTPEDASYDAEQLAQIQESPKQAGEKIYEEWRDDQGRDIPSFFDAYRAQDLIIGAKALRGTPEGDQIAHDPLIDGDTKYIWGGARVLAAEGNITLAGAEDNDANGKAVLSGPTPVEGITSPEGKEIREEAALKLITRDEKLTKETPVALVYGTNHDFTDDVRNHNIDNNANVGLIRIDPRACSK